jgi:cobalt/nickel transport system permease protein
MSGYVGLNLAAFCASLELGIQPLVAHAPDGSPLYCPYGLAESVPGMMLPHLLIFGPVEALATAGVVAWAARSGVSFDGDGGRAPRNGLLWGALGALCLLSPLGLLAAGDAWGEWAPEDLRSKNGVVPSGLAKLAGAWHAVLPDYNVPGWEGGKKSLGYVVSAVAGVTLIALVVLVVGQLATRWRRGPEVPGAGPDPGAPRP